MTILIYIVIFAGLITIAYVAYLGFRGGLKYDDFDDESDEIKKGGN